MTVRCAGPLVTHVVPPDDTFPDTQLILDCASCRFLLVTGAGNTYDDPHKGVAWLRYTDTTQENQP